MRGGAGACSAALLLDSDPWPATFSLLSFSRVAAACRSPSFVWRNIIVASLALDGDAVATPELIERLLDACDEDALVVAFTPALLAARGLTDGAHDPCPRILVNRSRSQWLHALRGRSRGCVLEFFEAKASAGELTIADYGQVADDHSRAPGRVRLVKAQLDARGSRDVLRVFFDAPFYRGTTLCANRACIDSNIHIR